MRRKVRERIVRGWQTGMQRLRSAARASHRVTTMQVLGLTAACILILVAILLAAILRKDITWQLNLTARTEIAKFFLVSRTQWSIDPAVVCGPFQPQIAQPGDFYDPICGSESWHVWPARHKGGRRTLDLTADENDPVEVDISTDAGGMVEMTLKRISGSSLGMLDTSESFRTLPSRLNIKWPPSSRFDEHSTLVLPFSGETTVGRDVAWSVQKSLHDGRLAVFAESGEALAGRTLTEESTLILGDQVVLDGVRDGNNMLVLPKGFIRFTTVRAKEGLKLMDIVMFARAEGVRIQRYGGGEYSFNASWWIKIKHQSALVIAIVLLTGLLTLTSAVVNIALGLAALRKNAVRQ